MMQSTRVNLPPTLSTLELLDRAFRIYRDNFLSFLVPVAIVTVPLTLINLVVGQLMASSLDESGFTNLLYSGRNTTGAASSRWMNDLLSTFGNTFLILMLIAVAGAILQGVFVNGLLTYIASENHLGRKPTIGEAFRSIRERLLPLGGALFLFYVILFILSAALAFALFLCGFGFGVIVYVGIVLYAFLTPVLILERTGVGLGLRRAWMLGKARLWPVFGLIIAITVITSVINVGLNSITSLIIPTPDRFSTALTASGVLDIVLNSLVGIAIAPILPIALTLMYYDTRFRIEGLDILLRAAETPEARPADVISPPPFSGFLTGKDVTNMAIMAGGLIVLFVLYYGAIILFFGGTTRTGF
jgi:hypothetical protein